MSDLVAVTYPDAATVERARENLRKAVTAGVVQVEDVVVMSRDQDGTLEVRKGGTGVGVAATGGAVWGGLIGLVFLAPLFGMAVGALGAGAAWPGSRLGATSASEKAPRRDTPTARAEAPT